MDSLEIKALETIAAAVKQERDTITLDSTFEELGIDSLKGFDLLVDLEEACGVTFPDDDARAFTRVGDVVEALRELVAETKP